MGDADSYGVSIYYTYHATNAYVSLYNAYPKILTASFFTTGRLDEKEFKNYSESQRKKLDYDLAFLKRAKPDIMEFRGMCSSAGRYFDTIMKEKGIDLSFDYIKNGFGKVSAAQILESQKNNYVMETLFTIAIIMNAGVDEDYEFVGQNDYIYNQILYSLTNIKKIYNLLKRSNKEDLIDSYMLSSALFSEKIPSKYNELVRRFRNSCENVSAYNLVPLLCNTYSTVFAFLIKYPNKEMVDNLELLTRYTSLPTYCAPSAGIPDNKGHYPETAKKHTETLRAAAERGILSIVGGCCGTTPDYTRSIAQMARHYKPRKA
jgi:hypothetical protein